MDLLSASQHPVIGKQLPSHAVADPEISKRGHRSHAIHTVDSACAHETSRALRLDRKKGGGAHDPCALCWIRHCSHAKLLFDPE